MSYEGAKASFNSAAEQYDRARPSYPAAAIRRIIEKSNLSSRGRILEVGAGTGKASVLFAKRGYRMLCLEPGIQMGEILRRNLQPFPKAQVETTTFEDWPLEKAAFDLVISAQAFHWVDPEIGYPKAAKALKPGGWIALFWNLPNDPETGIYKEIQGAYRKYAPDMARRFKDRPLSSEVQSMRERMASFSHFFPSRFVYQTAWKKTYTADSYIALLGTYSDHIALSKQDADRLYKAIRRIVEKHGGKHVKHYSTLIAMGQTSRRQSG